VTVERGESIPILFQLLAVGVQNVQITINHAGSSTEQVFTVNLLHWESEKLTVYKKP
jgi:hypothetical protein